MNMMKQSSNGSHQRCLSETSVGGGPRASKRGLQESMQPFPFSAETDTSLDTNMESADHSFNDHDHMGSPSGPFGPRVVIDNTTSSMSSSLLSCPPPCSKKQRCDTAGEDDIMDESAISSHFRRDSSSSVSSSSAFSSPQTRHRKSRNGAFTGQDFQRLIISQMR